MSCVQGDNYRKKKTKTGIIYGTGHLVIHPWILPVFFNLKFQRVITSQQGMVLWKQRESNKTVIEI